MADKKISQLTTLAQADVAVTADFLPIVDTSATETKKATPQSVVLGALGATSANVGINTASPSDKLDVVSGSATFRCRFRNSTGGEAFAMFQNSDTGTTSTDGLLCGLFSDESAYFWNYENAPIVFGTNNAERARIDASGNLGIGTATPRGDLDLGTSATSSTTKAVHLGYSVADFYGFRVANTNAAGSTFAGTFAIQRGTGSAWVDNVTVDDNANVTAGGGTLATNATNGFLYVPTCAGTPTGTPTAKTGYAPIVVNTTNNKLYFYSGGAWRDAGP